MSDKVELRVGADIKNKKPGIKIEHFISYHIDADLYTPADLFRLELANPETKIKKGFLCEVFINDKKELTGIIDKVHRKVKKSGVSLAVEGRDYMGLLVDSHCEPPFCTVTNMKLKALAEKLLAKVPFINRKDIIYQQNVVGKYKGKKKMGKSSTSAGYLSALDTGQKIGQIEPGMTIFEVLKNYSLSRGMLFYCMPDGTLVFGRPMVKGEPEYALTMLKTGKGNNVTESEVIEDISKCYSKYTVLGQQQGSQGYLEATQINTNNNSTPCIDADFPFYKPFVTLDNNDNVSPAMRARMLMEKHRREGEKLIYTVGRHSQNKQNWMINKFCHIKDEVQGLDGDYLIYGRTFELSKQDGPTTKIKLGLPGLIA
jgi:prophage tail gpP-like protein